MDDAEFEIQRQRLRTLSDKWVEAIGLGAWDVSMAYARDDFEVDGKPDMEATAKTNSNWRYLHGCITWNMPRVKEQDDPTLERIFVHELMHVYLNETRETGDDWLDHEERVASMLAKAFLGLRG